MLFQSIRIAIESTYPLLCSDTKQTFLLMMLQLNHFGNGVNLENLYNTVQVIAYLKRI